MLALTCTATVVLSTYIAAAHTFVDIHSHIHMYNCTYMLRMGCALVPFALAQGAVFSLESKKKTFIYIMTQNAGHSVLLMATTMPTNFNVLAYVMDVKMCVWALMETLTRLLFEPKFCNIGLWGFNL